MTLSVNIEGGASDDRRFRFYLMRGSRREEIITPKELKLLTEILYENSDLLIELSPGNRVCLEIPSAPNFSELVPTLAHRRCDSGA